MSNRTQMRERLRIELGDTGATTTWSDDLLDDLLVDSVTWYSRLWPLQSDAYRNVAADQRTFDVPPGALGVTQVECPPGRVLRVGREDALHGRHDARVKVPVTIE